MVIRTLTLSEFSTTTSVSRVLPFVPSVQMSLPMVVAILQTKFETELSAQLLLHLNLISTKETLDVFTFGFSHLIAMG